MEHDVATSPPAGWYTDPDGSAGQRYWDGDRWTRHRRPNPSAPRSPLALRVDGLRSRWLGMPAGLRLTVPVAAVLTMVGVAVYAWIRPLPDDWSQLPKRLSCQLRPGPTPPATITVASVDVSHPRGAVLRLVVRFAEPLPPLPSGSFASGFAGYLLTYTIANNGKEFAELGPQQDTDELAIRKPGESRGTEPNMRPDRNTNARRTAPDTVEINLETKRLGLDQAPVDPQLTFAAQFRTPSTVTVDFGSQFCQGERLAGQRR
ncbi:DUF2510 domain-containing protein [Mycobacterium tuberculosis]|uniref:DUF2510 domain-containing protein n=1 Tax=Mycobacterium tuberculosis TaxID=1773 RepID=UPI00207B4971|nr:DUF2510 domain-containing protein [Mycobacterium tuberculosis]MCN4331278.1 DUF2510 domain-containing protein [Mycobacterium tuberculosis]